MTPHLSPLSHHKNSPKDLAQSFKALIYELFSLEVAQADAQALHALGQSYGEFDFGSAIVCFASAASSETLSSSSLGHTNLAFSLICSKPSATLSKSLYAKATQAINRAIPSYNIIFFLNPQEDLLTISFATRREHKRAADQDVLERVIIIKDLSLLSPSKGHLRNLDSIAKASKHKKQTPTPIDQLYQESIKALSIESLNEKFYQEIVQIFIALIDSIQLPTPSLRGSEATEAIHPTPSLRADEIGAAIHKSKVDSSDEAMDCHADKSARNDRKNATNKKVDSKRNAKNLSEQAQDSRICDEKSGLCEHSQGRALGVRNRRECEAIAAFSQKANAQNAASQDNTKREFSLRLLSRLLFCKFLEKKGVIDQAIFSTTLSGNYYHEVLEPLFFTTLNTPKNARDYDLLDPHIAALLEQIPYLNGGLFAPQASDFYSPQKPTAYHATLKVPNAPLAELFTLLESYHFSIDESTPDSQEVGLNPELLGMVFESLLSELFTDNRKDSTASLRKSTGSYYTPREIVRYMCRSSLYQYLVSKMDSAFGLESRISSPRLCDSHSRLISARGSKSHDSSSKILESTTGDKTAEQQSCREQTTPESSTAKPAAAVQGEAAAGFFRNLRILEEKNQAEQTALKSTFDTPTTNAHLSSLRGSEATEAIHPTPSLRALREQSVAIHKSKMDSSGLPRSLTTSRNDSKNAANKKADSSPNAPTPSLRADEIGAAIHKLIFHQDPSHLPQTTHAQILAALSTLKVLDPACGSGAFPIGLMQEILDLQDLLGDTRSPYTRKLEILQSNIYGIDIQPMATEISRLRCFLSLILEEAPRDIKPLPNLEFKFLSANSLLALPQDSMLEYDGYQADKQKLESIRQANFTADLKSRESLKQDYLETAAHIARNLILHAQGESPLTSWNPYDPHSVAEFFDSEYMFGLSGFDIVIGNPPYIGEKGHRELFATIKASTLNRFYLGKMDYFYFFFHQGLNLLKDNGALAFITTNYFPTAKGGKKLRQDFKDRAYIYELINFGEHKPFINAQGQHNAITLLRKLHAPHSPTTIYTYHAKSRQNLSDLNKALQNESIFTTHSTSNLYEGDECYMRITPTTQGDSSLESIFAKMLSHSTRLDTLCNINQGIVSGIDKVTDKHLSKYDWADKGYKKGDGVYILSKDEAKAKGIESTILKPCYKNSDISRYIAKSSTNQYILYLTGKETESSIPNTLKHLANFKQNLMERREMHNGSKVWWSLWWSRKPEIFATAKIICPQRSPRNTFAYDNGQWYAMTDVFFITAKDDETNLLFILGLLNSSLYYLWLYHKGKRKGESLELIQTPLSEIPIPKITESNRSLCDEIIKCVEQILSLRGSEATEAIQPQSSLRADEIGAAIHKQKELESQIDSLVYTLYNLSNDEIATIES